VIISVGKMQLEKVTKTSRDLLSKDYLK